MIRDGRKIRAKLTGLVIENVGIVDAGANQLADVVICKRRDGDQLAGITAPERDGSAEALRKALAREAQEAAELRRVLAEAAAESTDLRGESMTEEQAITKRLEGDVSSGCITTPRATIERLVKSRTREIWIARGAQPGTDAAIADEVWRSPLSGIGTATPHDPSLQEIYRAAPESTAEVQAVAKAAAGVQAALAAFDRYVEQVQRAHPTLTRPAAVSKALLDAQGVRLYRDYARAQDAAARVAPVTE